MGLGAAGTAAAIGAAGSVVGGGISALGASSAAGTASKAAQQSAQLQLAQMQSNIARTDPFVTQGQIAAQQLPGAVGVPMDLSGQPTVANMPTPPAAFQWNPTMEGLAQTPGYQFTLQQALQAQQNSATARGLGVSGAQLRGAADYAGGAASTTYNQQLQNALNIWGTGITGYNAALAGFGAGQGAYQNQFQDYWANQQNRFGNLLDVSKMGAGAATGQAQTATTAASNVGSATLAGGQAQAAGQQGVYNALGGALSSPQVNTALTQGINYLTGAGTTASTQAAQQANPNIYSALTYGMTPLSAGGSTITPPA